MIYGVLDIDFEIYIWIRSQNRNSKSNKNLKNMVVVVLVSLKETDKLPDNDILKDEGKRRAWRIPKSWMNDVECDMIIMGMEKK